MTRSLTLTLVGILLAFIANAQQLPIDHKAYEDSVFKHFMKEGAWRQPLFSRARERYIDSALALLPTNAYIWEQKSMPLIKQHKYQLSMRYVDSAVKYDPKAWVEYRAFLKCIFQKDYEAALVDFELARSINGNSFVMDHPYDFYSALCYLQMNRFDAAEALLRKCIDERRAKLGDKWVHYLHWFYLGVLCYEQERYAEALDYLEKSLVTYPRFSDCEYYKALCYARIKDYKTALPIMEQAAADEEKGYTMNEDNAYYEIYPYQVQKYFMRTSLQWLQEMNKPANK